MQTTVAATDFLRKAQLQGILERICQGLELPPTRQKLAEERYHTIGKLLNESDDPLLTSAEIYPQGSVSHQTTVKPVGQEEHDLDLVCLLAAALATSSPSAIKKLIGDRLRECGYCDILEEKPRCWRINYANEFHLDITPSIPNPACGAGGELVPDKKLKTWKASNLRGYRKWYEVRAALCPRLMSETKLEMCAAIQELPQPTRIKGILRRSVQLCKRHRDLYFSSRGAGNSPISIILTTLAAKSYAACVSEGNAYQTDLDVFLDVVRRMPSHIDVVTSGGSQLYLVLNETTAGENFAEKWNDDPRLAHAFFRWHDKALADFQQMTLLSGLDDARRHLSGFLGEKVVSKAMNSLTEGLNVAREHGDLSVTPTVGLAIGTSRGTQVRRNTFYGS